jgi:hypothetical protein
MLTFILHTSIAFVALKDIFAEEKEAQELTTNKFSSSQSCENVPKEAKRGNNFCHHHHTHNTQHNQLFENTKNEKFRAADLEKLF